MNTMTEASHPITFRTYEKEISIYGAAQALQNINSFANEFANTLGYSGDVAAIVAGVESSLDGFNGEYMNTIYETIQSRLIDAKYPLTKAGLAAVEAVTK